MIQPDHFLKLPQTDNILPLLIQSITRIYGPSICQKTKPLLQQFTTNRTNIKLGSYQFLIPSNTAPYLNLLQSHIILTSAMISKLEFPSNNFRFLDIEIGWLDTFTEQKVIKKSLYYELVSTVYNYLMAGLLKSNQLLRKRKYLEAREILGLSLGVGEKLLGLVRKNSFDSKDLHPDNVECLLRIGRGYWYFSYVIVMESNKDKKLYNEKAALYFSAYKNFQEVEILAKRNRIHFERLYLKLCHFYMILCHAEFCIRMIKDCDMYLSQRPELFKDSLGYCLRGLKAIPKADPILQSYQWAILEGKRDELGRTHEHLSYRNEQIYKTQPTPSELLPQQTSQTKVEIVLFAKSTPKEFELMLEEFWDSEVDLKSQELQKFVYETVEKIKTQFVLLQNQIKSLVTKQKLDQQRNAIKKIELLSSQQTLSTLEETVQYMKDNHFDLKTKISQLSQKQSCPKIKRWCSQNLGKLEKGEFINKQIHRSLVSKKDKIVKLSSIKPIPKFKHLNQSFEFMYAKIQQLEELKLKPYHQTLLKKWRENRLEEGKKEIEGKVLSVAERWEKELLKLSNKVMELSQNQNRVEEEYTREIVSIREKQEAGLKFYSKLSEQLEKVKPRDNKN